MGDQRLKNKTVLTSSQKKMKRSNVNEDGANSITTFPFDHLPCDVVENVFSFLPINKVARFALFSKRFKNSWQISRDLCFDEEFARCHFKEDFINIINQVMSMHCGSNIRKFHLYFDHSGMETLVDYWIKYVTNKGVEELHLDFSPGHKAYILLSDHIDVSTLRELKLTFCEFLLAPKLTGLCFLKSLILEQIHVMPALIQTLFSNCLLLENLELVKCFSIYRLIIAARGLRNFEVLKVKNCYDISSMHIDAPELCTFQYHGDVCKMKFYCQMRKLKDVVLNLAPGKGFQQLFDRENLIFCLKSAKSLTISSTFLEGLSPRYENFEYKEVEFCFMFLEEFELHMGAQTYINPCDIAYFLKKCPRLERIAIDLDELKFRWSLYWELQAKRNLTECKAWFPFLKLIRLKGFKHLQLELELVKFFLKNAKVLENLIIDQAKKIYPVTPDSEFMHCVRTTKAKIEINEYPFTKVLQDTEGCGSCS